jgi:hypothetical protein
LYVLDAESFISENNKGSNPACSKPNERPPQPENKSIQCKLFSLKLLINYCSEQRNKKAG